MIRQMRLHRGAADDQSVRVWRIPWRNVANGALIGITCSGEICVGCCRRLRFHRQEGESKKNTTQKSQD